MKRLPDWERRLVAYEELIRDVPFRWGVHDCASATVGMLEAITGEDLGKYLPTGRLRMFLYRAGRLGVLARVRAARVGLETCAPKLAHRGDPLVVAVKGRDCLSWIGSDGGIVALTWSGAVRLTPDAVRFAWRVP